MSQQASLNDRRQALCEKAMQANIPVIGTPIRPGQESSVCRVIIERLYAESGKLSERISRSDTAATAAASSPTAKPASSTAMPLLYAPQHPGCTVPPQADTGWIGETRPGLSCGDTAGDDAPVGDADDRS